MSAGRRVQKRMPASSSPRAANGDVRARVLQHLDVLRRQRRRHVAVVVVIAEDGEDAVRRAAAARAAPRPGRRTRDRRT